ncbi:MAG TPA: hypothetical protein VHO01_00315 [Jatrophihabitans sp.]|nr:hypothetical protein [Jatrophihabitans sp.]
MTSSEVQGPDWLRLAGWSSASAELMFLCQQDRHALAVFATKSRPPRYQLSVFTTVSREWQVIHESADVNLVSQVGWTSSCVYGWGKLAHGSAQVTVEYRGVTYTVDSDPAGWWGFLHDTDPTAGDLLTPTLLDHVETD